MTIEEWLGSGHLYHHTPSPWERTIWAAAQADVQVAHDERLALRDMMCKLTKRLEVYSVYAKSAYKRLKWGDFNRYAGRCDELKEILADIEQLIT